MGNKKNKELKEQSVEEQKAALQLHYYLAGRALRDLFYNNLTHTMQVAQPCKMPLAEEALTILSVPHALEANAALMIRRAGLVSHRFAFRDCSMPADIKPLFDNTHVPAWEPLREQIVYMYELAQQIKIAGPEVDNSKEGVGTYTLYDCLRTIAPKVWWEFAEFYLADPDENVPVEPMSALNVVLLYMCERMYGRQGTVSDPIMYENIETLYKYAQMGIPNK